jgi:hypothetical protein
MGARLGRTDLAECTLSNATEKHEMEEVDVSIEIYRLDVPE